MKKYSMEETENIDKLYHATKDTVMQRKYLVIRLHMKGYTNKEITEVVGLDRTTIKSYIIKYAAWGADGLIPKKSPGRPGFLTKEQQQLLYKTISEKTPEESGFDGIKNWTAKIACMWVSNEFGVRYQVNGMLDLFHRLNLSHTRPTYVLAKADPKKQEEFREGFENVKKNY
jgi:putative transposase